ncbi:MAG: O-antigen ligase family protein [Sedimentisphaerales bacterium]|nr:O-antigen ligase family protein [Sedimentisphaerales bacterium]
MATFIAVLCVIAIAICVPLVIFKPKWVFYIFLISAVFHNVLASYINIAGNLGMPRTWAPADILAWLTLAAAIFVRKERLYPSDLIGKCFIIIAILTLIALIQGLLMYTDTAFTHSRVTHFVAAMIFGLRYFTNFSRVNGFLKFSILLLLVMFGVHVVVRFGIYTPRVAEIEAATQLAGERGTYTLVPLLYLSLVSIAIGRIASKVGFSIISILMLAVGIAGIILSETRSMYGVMAIIIIASILFMKGRIRTMLAFGIVGILAFGATSVIGFDFMERFRAGSTRSGNVEIPKPFEEGTWRALENKIIISSYQKEPYFLLTGRGIGALHPAPAGKSPLVGFYHSEYLSWLDRSGVLGLATVLLLIFAMLVRSFALARSDIPYIRYYGTTSFLLMLALAADGFFHPIFSNPRGAPVLICFAAIIANWQDINASLYPEEDAYKQENPAEEIHPEFAYAQTDINIGADTKDFTY